MGYTGVIERGFTDVAESEFLVKRNRLGLGVEVEVTPTFQSGIFDQRVHHLTANAVSSPRFEDRDTPDLTAIQKPRRSHGLSCAAYRHDVKADRVDTVHLQLYRDFLLNHEYFGTYFADGFSILFPDRHADVDRSVIHALESCRRILKRKDGIGFCPIDRDHRTERQS